MTAKLAPLRLVPVLVPPVGTVYQLMLLPEEVAFKFEVAFMQTVEGVAVTEVGADGKGDTPTVVVTEFVHEKPLVTV